MQFTVSRSTACRHAAGLLVVVLSLGLMSVAPSRASAQSAPAQSAAQVWFDEPGVAHGSDAITLAEVIGVVQARRGSLVVASVFRLTTLAFIERLLNAASRGVHVEVLLNGGNRCVRKAGCPSTAVKLLARLNRMSDPRSWLRTCDGGTPANHEVATSNGDGCIGQTLDHNKFFAFSATSLTEGGTPEPLVLQTSTNNTTSQYRHAWNDALLLGGQSAVYQDYLRYFRDMVHAASSSAPTRAMYFTRRSGTTVDTTTVARRDIETWSFPRAPSDDPVADVLHRVPTARRCANRVAPGDAGPGRSHVYAAVAYINGRPLLIRQLVRLQESGCVVQVIYTTISPQDRSELTAAGVQLYQACTPADSQDDETRQYLHSKFFLVDGSDTSVGSNRRLVYTGSENWNSQSLSSADNRMMRYVEPATPKASTSTSSPLFDDYMSRWQELQAAVEANGQPTADTCHGATDY